jgi:Uma2 family endonuclease
MSILTEKHAALPNGKGLTIADIAVMPRDLPSGPVDYELDNGRIIAMSPPGNRHSALQTRLSATLVKHGDDRGIGETRVEVGIVLWRKPDRLVGADVAFFAKSSFPLRESAEGYIETIPDLIFEVRSKNHTDADVQHKLADYLAARVKQVLVVDPEAKTVAIHRMGASAVILGEQDVLRLDDVIPGFSLSMVELFRP